jgi:hypothetical protein
VTFGALRGKDLNLRPLGYEKARHQLSAVESIAQRRKSSFQNRFCQLKCCCVTYVQTAKVWQLIHYRWLNEIGESDSVLTLKEDVSGLPAQQVFMFG